MTGFLIFVYQMLTGLLLPFLLLAALAHTFVDPAFRLFYFQRLGMALPPRSMRRPVWIHAVSMGEVLSSVPLISRLRQEGYVVCLSVGTRSGFSTAARHLPEIPRFYLPFDVPWCVRRVLRHVSPTMVLVSEVEIWPVFVRCVKAAGTPLFLINGRIPEMDFRYFYRLRFFYNRVLLLYDGLFMQGERDAERMRQICNHGNLQTLGNLKFDVSAGELSPELSALIPQGGITLCGASTHPGDEKLILEAFRRIHERNHDSRLILAPISQSRVKEVARLVSKYGLTAELRSANRKSEKPVFILDSTGELAGLFSRCDLTVMGGTFSRRTGGHNIIEPALHGNCILCGPHMENFQDAHDLFNAAEAFIQTSADRLAADLFALTADVPGLRRIGQKAKALIVPQQGATERVFQAISGPFAPRGAV